jgi:transcriptional regulator GlxA family with amidase domain
MFQIPLEWTSLPKGLERKIDTIFVGSASRISPAAPRTLDFLRHATGKCRRIASSCAGETPPNSASRRARLTQS